MKNISFTIDHDYQSWKHSYGWLFYGVKFKGTHYQFAIQKVDYMERYQIMGDLAYFT